MIDLSFCREQFPALKQKIGEYPAAFLDGPGGTQVPQSVIDAITDYLIRCNSNTHGAFRTSALTDDVIRAAREAMKDMLGARSSDEIAFGQNMTTLNFAVARALARGAKEGQEVVATEMDHHANIDPWRTLQDYGFVFRQVRFDPASCTLDLDDLKQKLSPKTRLVAVGYASNAVGTVNDVKEIVRMAHEVGALALVDAVHYAPHGPIDVADLDCDFLLCSAYKFFGPHVGVLYCKKEVGDVLSPFKVAPQDEAMPYKFETGTLNHEGIAGVTAAIDFIASLGEPWEAQMDGLSGLTGRRRSVVAGMRAIESHEQPLLARLLEGLSSIPGVRVYGPPPGHPRTPTVSFTVAGHAPCEVAKFLGERGLFVWDGDFYATTLVKRLGLYETGGLVRVGLAPYNTPDEIERLLSAVAHLVSSGR